MERERKNTRKEREHLKRKIRDREKERKREERKIREKILNEKNSVILHTHRKTKKKRAIGKRKSNWKHNHF